MDQIGTVSHGEVHKIPADLIGDAARHAAILIHDSHAQKFTPLFGGGFEPHCVGKIGEYLFWNEVKNSGIHITSTPIRESYTKLSANDDFMLVVDDKDVQVEVKTANVFKPLDELPMGFKFMLNAAQRPFKFDWVVSIFVNLSDLTYRIMGCVERDSIAEYPIAGSYGVRHYEIPPESLLSIRCIWEGCAWNSN
ncbi:MAG: hypothetical protein J7K40_12120 [candidate division Zixibacteria bacterium]|nr:hypothetical protein [candidate division Zixibacteria bacterium]